MSGGGEGRGGEGVVEFPWVAFLLSCYPPGKYAGRRDGGWGVEGASYTKGSFLATFGGGGGGGRGRGGEGRGRKGGRDNYPDTHHHLHELFV